MKHFFIFCVLALTTQVLKAESLSCSRDAFGGSLHKGADHTYGIVDVVEASCSNGKLMKIQGAGLGLRGSMVTGFTLNCFGDETASPRKYYGLKADAGLIFGGSAAVFGSKAGFCVLGGLGFNFVGASITGSQLTIE